MNLIPSLTEIKEKVLLRCEQYVLNRINTAQHAIDAVEAAGEEDTKSSAGDKYETSREMMKQEIERNFQLLSEAKQMQLVLHSLKQISNHTSLVRPGSLIQTDQRMFYLAIGIGKLHVEGLDVFVLSPSAPVGQLLIGKQIGDQITFNQKTYLIQDIM